MGALDSIVTVSISATSAEPTRGNFGTPLFLQYHTHNTDKVRTYTDLPGLISDGFSANDPVYLWATKVLSQDPHPPSYKVGRATSAQTYSFTFLVTDNTNGDSVGLTVLSPLGVSTACYHTPASESTSAVATAVAALLDALPGSSASAVGSTVTFTSASAGDMWFPSGIKGGTFTDATPSSSPGTDLDAIRLVDDDWYGVTGMLMSDADITAVAVWTAANQKTHYYTTADSANILGTSSGVMHDLKAAGYTRSYGQFSGQPYEYSASALEALEFTYDPGTYTDAFKQLNGITVDALTPTQKTNITGNNGNYYVNQGGVNATFDGRTAATGRFMDLTRFLDALQNDMQIRIYTLLVNLPKVPLDQLGLGMIGAEIRSSLQSFVVTGALSNDPGSEPKVTIPDASSISTADRQARKASGFKFSCLYATPTHSVSIQGTVNV